jgi:dipeptidyl aminopeptidase/acylaminoacyl peptidase
LAQPELRIAGLRINPQTNGSSRGYSYNGLIIQHVPDGRRYPVKGLPEDPRIRNISWAPDGQKIAFTIEKQNGIELWIADVINGQARSLTGPVINDTMGRTPYLWFSDSKTLLYKSIWGDRGEPPPKPPVPEGPVVQEATGEKAPVRTYQDLLRNSYDEMLFEYFTRAQLNRIDIESGETKKYGDPGIIENFSISPDNQYMLIIYIKQPYSYIVPYYRFANSVRILDNQGKLVKTIAELPPAENIPKGFGAVATGPRSFTWRNDVPATLYWVEAQDGGDPSNEVDYRDKLYFLKAPFDKEKVAGINLKLRFGNILWGNEITAIIEEWWWTTRESITSIFNPSEENSRQPVFIRSFEDRYNDPGNFQTKMNSSGMEVLLTDKKGKNLYLFGRGASPEGNRPFIREFNMESREINEIWRSEAPYYEYPVQMIDIRNGLTITRRESKENPPNYFLRNLRKNSLESLTDFPHPYPQLEGIEKEVITYRRSDGVDLKGDLYLPKGYTPEQGTLPVIMWAYPDEFKSADYAGQVSGSPYEFIRLSWNSPLYFLTQGYAVFDDPGMPVVGEGDVEPNDNFRNQLVLNAEAAIDALIALGIADPKQIAIGGHSYGAFMTANLLAHSDLFAAGIARSGAYNRTLTPFGFQSEERTYWEAPDIYYQMSPFMHADKINEPILLIHGEADNNSGTFPLQSERLFAAIKGLGGNARFVMLPHESHGYRARESILHMLWEINEFLEKYVRKKGS